MIVTRVYTRPSYGCILREGMTGTFPASAGLMQAAGDPAGYELCYKVMVSLRKSYSKFNHAVDQASQLLLAMQSSSPQGFSRSIFTDLYP